MKNNAVKKIIVIVVSVILSINMMYYANVSLASDLSGWKETYIEYIQNKYKKSDEYTRENMIFKLIKIDNDDVPELYINYGSTAGGDGLCYIYDGSVIEQHLYNYGLSYIEESNRFMDSGGHMDVYYDKVYHIENGRFIVDAEGDFGAKDNSNIQLDSDGFPIYDYYWNDVKVSSGKYKELLEQNFDKKQAKDPFDGAEYDSKAGRYVGAGLCDYEEIIFAIEIYGESNISDFTKINYSSIKLRNGETVKLQLLGVLDSVKLNWKTKNKNIARVDTNGNVTAGSAGKTTVFTKYNGKKYSCRIKVTGLKVKCLSVGKKYFVYKQTRTGKIDKKARRLRVKLIEFNYSASKEDEDTWTDGMGLKFKVLSGKLKGKGIYFFPKCSVSEMTYINNEKKVIKKGCVIEFGTNVRFHSYKKDKGVTKVKVKNLYYKYQ